MMDSRRPEEGRTEAVELGLHILSQAGLPFLFGSGLLWFETPRTGFCCFLQREPDTEAGAKEHQDEHHASENSTGLFLSS